MDKVSVTIDKLLEIGSKLKKIRVPERIATSNVRGFRIKGTKYPIAYRGAVILPKGWVNRFSEEFEINPSAKKALSAVTLAHEGLELKKMPKTRLFGLMYEHASPKVVLIEHNILKNLKGAGADDIRSASKKLRTREENLISKLTNREFKHGYSPRFSRHAIKNILKKYDQYEFDLIDKTVQQ